MRSSETKLILATGRPRYFGLSAIRPRDIQKSPIPSRRAPFFPRWKGVEDTLKIPQGRAGSWQENEPTIDVLEARIDHLSSSLSSPDMISRRPAQVAYLLPVHLTEEFPSSLISSIISRLKCLPRIAIEGIARLERTFRVKAERVYDCGGGQPRRRACRSQET